MADVTITDLPDAGSLAGTELIEVAKLSSAITITASTISAQASDNSYNDSADGFLAAGFAVDDRVMVSGFTGNAANNITVGKITSVTAGKVTIGGTDGDVIVDDAAGESVTITKWVSRRTTTQDVGGGGSEWTLAGTGQTVTGIYDFAVDGAKANIDFAGLGSYNELLIIGRLLTTAISGIRQVLVSVDNGSSFYTASGDYVVVAGGGEVAAGGFNNQTSSSAAARDVCVHILNTKGASKLAMAPNGAPMALFVASTSDINAIRVFNAVGGGNITGGTVHVYGR